MIRRALVAASMALVVAVGTVPLVASATPRAADPPQLQLLDQPVTVAPDGTFPVFVAALDAPAATELAVDIYDRVEPGEVVGVEPAGGAEATFPVVPLDGADPNGRRTAAFTISLFTSGQPNPDPAWGWRIDEPGVYPVRVRLLDADGNRLSTLMTSIIRLPGPGQTVTQTKAALLVGIHRPPPDDAADRATPDTADQGLLDELDPVLAQLNARPTLPAGFAITPDTIARVAGDDAAAQELARLRAELAPAGRTLIDAPYVDIDVASLVGAGLADAISLERDLGRQTLSDLLERPTAGTWQIQDRVDEAALAELRSRGIYRTLLPGDAMAGGAGVLAPAELAAGDGTVQAVAVSDAYALAKESNDPVLAAHRLLGRLAATGAGPTGSPAVVVAIDPGAVDTDSLRIVADALSFGSPFFAATGLADLLDAQPQATAARLATPTLPALGTYPLTYRRSQASLDSYAAMVGRRPELLRPFDLTLAVSAAADLALPQRQRDAASVQVDLREPFTSITIPTKDRVTLGARDARFPLPIESSLDYPVQVVIELEATDRVEFPRNRIERTLEPGRQVIPIRVKTRAAGDTPVRITVRSPDDGVILDEGQYTIRSTAVSGVGVVLTIGAAVFLALWWGRHWKRNRGSRGPTSPPAPDPVVDAAPEPEPAV